MMKGSAGIRFSNAGKERVLENKLNSEVFMVYCRISLDPLAVAHSRIVLSRVCLSSSARLSVCFCFESFSGL